MNGITRTAAGAAALVAAAALALAGCAGPQQEEADPSTARFMACLTAAGVTAKIGDGGLVMVRTRIEPAGAGDAIEFSTDDSGDPDAMPVLVEGGSDGATWIAARSAAAFADDPDLRDAYAACEAEHPDFAQSEYDPLDDPALQQQLALQRENELALARCARDAGFAWVADPPADGGGIELPADLAEAEFRALLLACPEPLADGVGWRIDDDLDFDWLAVLDEVAGGGGGVSVVRDGEPE